MKVDVYVQLVVLQVLLSHFRFSNGFYDDDDEDGDPMNSFGFFKPFDHGIKNCQMNPYICSILCGSAGPGCDMEGQCNCLHHPSSDHDCKIPTFFEDIKCNSFFCRRKNSNAYVCKWKDEKFCVCAPAPRVDL